MPSRGQTVNVQRIRAKSAMKRSLYDPINTILESLEAFGMGTSESADVIISAVRDVREHRVNAAREQRRREARAKEEEVKNEEVKCPYCNDTGHAGGDESDPNPCGFCDGRKEDS